MKNKNINVTADLIAKAKYGRKLAEVRAKLAEVVDSYSHYGSGNGPGQQALKPLIEMLIEAIDSAQYPDHKGWNIVAEKSMKEFFVKNILEWFFENHPESLMGDLPYWEYEEVMNVGELFGIYLSALKGGYSQDVYILAFFDGDGDEVERKEVDCFSTLEAVGFARGYMCGKENFKTFEIGKK